MVVMSGVWTDISYRDIGVKHLKFPGGDNGTDAVVSPGIREANLGGSQ